MGFRKNYSTENAIYFLLEQVLERFNKKLFPLEIFCDFSKEFDCANILYITRENGKLGNFKNVLLVIYFSSDRSLE